MNPQLLIDMNMSPLWVDYLCSQGFSAHHWIQVGDPRAPDTVVLNWANAHHQVLLTQDLDFGIILAQTAALAPSVVQVRGQNVLPDNLGQLLVAALRQHRDAILTGVLMTIDPTRARVRLLPLRNR